MKEGLLSPKISIVVVPGGPRMTVRRAAIKIGFLNSVGMMGSQGDTGQVTALN